MASSSRLQLGGLREVAGADDLARLAREGAADPAHLGEVGRHLGGQHRLGVAAAGGLRDVQREVAHALDVTRAVDRGDHDAQVGRHRGLQRQQRERLLLGAVAQLVDADVFGDHFFGQVQIALQQRPGRLGQRFRDLLAHAREARGQLVELVLIGVAHGPRVTGRLRSKRICS